METIEVRRRDLLETLRFLEELVLSLNRLGSAGGSAQEFGNRLRQYVVDWQVFRRAATIRAALGEYFSYELGADEMDELERELQDTRHWSLSEPAPGAVAARDWWRPLGH